MKKYNAILSDLKSDFTQRSAYLTTCNVNNGTYSKCPHSFPEITVRDSKSPSDFELALPFSSKQFPVTTPTTKPASQLNLHFRTTLLESRGPFSPSQRPVVSAHTRNFPVSTLAEEIIKRRRANAFAAGSRRNCRGAVQMSVAGVVSRCR